MSNVEKFNNLLRSTGRKGIDECINSLYELGFYTAPASTKFHLCHPGGLLEHSLNVYNAALKLRDVLIAMKPELESKLHINSIIIASLLHDVCKADIYRECIKRQKNASGYWIDVDGYETDYSSFPLGHGEKSVISLLRTGLELTDDEIIAIRWHMNAWDLPFQSYESKSNFNSAKDKSPLLTLIQSADGISSSLLESNC